MNNKKGLGVIAFFQFVNERMPAFACKDLLMI